MSPLFGERFKAEAERFRSGMSFTVFLGNLPAWVTADDIKSWLTAESLVADQIKVIRNPETQESKGFAFIEAPNNDEMQSIIKRFDRAPLEDRLLRANPAQPPKGKRPMGAPSMMGAGGPMGAAGGQGGDRPREGRRPNGMGGGMGAGMSGGNTGQVRRPAAADGSAAPAGGAPTGAAGAPPSTGAAPNNGAERRRERDRRGSGGSTSAFAEELAKAL